MQAFLYSLRYLLARIRHGRQHGKKGNAGTLCNKAVSVTDSAREINMLSFVWVLCGSCRWRSCRLLLCRIQLVAGAVRTRLVALSFIPDPGLLRSFYLLVALAPLFRHLLRLLVQEQLFGNRPLLLLLMNCRCLLRSG